MAKKVAVYARCSTTSQDISHQLLELRQVADRNGWIIIEEYIDHGISGSKSRNQRPALDKLLKDSNSKRFETIMCFEISRLGRSLQDLIQILNEVHKNSIDCYFHTQQIDTTTPHGKMMFSIIGALAEWEREQIRERIKSGIANARAKGKKLGRPSKMNDGMRNAILLLREKGMGIKKISQELQVG
jgi:DNA invertase Pin-like site-specific DNA recombinase